ncbi:MAG: hypothetical protein OER95_06245 [Acidimicrobiia bacterium]|nr:hypothetical protein [Acidimicrobiia bacterium]
MSSPSVPRNPFSAAAVCVPGFEGLCRRELQALGLRPKPAGPGLVEFKANSRQLYAANVWLRTAGRVLVRLATFRATDFIHLQEHASRIDWSRWVGPGFAPSFRITTTDSKLYHTKAIAQRLHQVSLPPSTGEPEQMFVVRIHRNTVTISVDSSGQALHHRPWRTELGSAPLRATMAAACLLACDWPAARPGTGPAQETVAERPAEEPPGKPPGRPLIDPFCGSGVFPIEAALLALGLPPGGERPFAFRDWPDFDTGAWASVAGTVAQAYDTVGERTDDLAPILASDRDNKMVEAARNNAERAEVADVIEFETRVISHLKAQSGPGLLITNPPYGKRLGSAKLENLYRRFGAVARERLPGFDLALVTSHAKLAAQADGAVKPIVGFRHGGVAVRLYYRPGVTESDEGSSDRAGWVGPAGVPASSDGGSDPS